MKIKDKLVNGKKTTIILAFVAIAALCFIVWQIIRFVSFYDPFNLRMKPDKCIFPKVELSGNDLAGTWYAGSPERNDTLIIREDGSYKQIIHIGYLDIDYESLWLQWWLDYSEKGIPYLHLDGMRLCAAEPEIVSCDVPGGQGPWFDICQNEALLMNKEGILIILGTPRQVTQSTNNLTTLRGIFLSLPMGYENTWVYSLQNP